jgi:eukaryotic-like serine/threonine-protein kinase
LPSESARLQQAIEFGEDFELDPLAYQLRRSGNVLKLEPTPMEILLFLIEQRGELVSREKIAQRVWGKDVFVDTDNSINGAIRKIRQVLNDDPEAPRFIQTVTGKGYRFVAPIVEPIRKESVPSSGESLIGKRVWHYRVLELLGGGGMGLVYRAEDLKLGRQVALKFLPSELVSDKAAFGRLQREARAASVLDHPNICSIYELGEYEGQPFIVMPLLEGKTLREWIEENQDKAATCIDSLLDFGMQIAGALEAAHQKKIIHRDIKPANIFITKHGQIKVLDFGVATFEDGTEAFEAVASGGHGTTTSVHEFTDTSLTRTGLTIGTPSYLSPEQVAREKLDARTDIFSFGLVLYEMATGRRAFFAKTATDIRNAVLNQPEVPASQLNPAVPPELERILSKVLEKDRERRYQSAEEIKIDLERLWEKRRRSTAARPFSHYRGLIVGALVATLLAAGILALLWRPSRRLPFESVKTIRLTSNGKAAKAAISPDGRYIAHTMLTGGQESLLVRQANMLYDSEVVPPQPVRYMGLTFSNDSAMVYYVVRSAGDETPTLYRIAVVGGTPEKVKDHLDSPITFSPDGKKFAFVRELANESTLVVAELDSGREQTLISRKLPEVLDYPAWSPDGRIIACSNYNSAISNRTGSNTRIIAVRVSDRSESPLSKQTWGSIRKVVWLRNGRGLVLTARPPEEASFPHLWYVSYPEGIGRKITEDLSSQDEASVSADAHQIVTIQANTFTSIWRTDSGSSRDPELVMSGESGSSAPVWAPDGRIIFEEELQGSRSLWSVEADGKNRRQLTQDGNSYDYSVSQDGSKVAFVSDRSGVPAIWTMNMDGGNPVMAAKPSGEPVQGGTVPQISPDGKWIAFASLGSGHWTSLWRVSSNGGKPVELNDKLWLRPSISPNEKWIAGFYDEHRLSTQTNPTNIAVISSEGGRPRKLFPIPPSVLISGGLRWSPDSRQVFYIDRRNDGDNVWAQPVNGGAPHQVTHLQGVELFSFDWSRDGKQLVFSRGVQASDVMLVEDAGQR